MDQRAAAARYRVETVESAPPLKIVRMMYQGAMRFLDRAAELDPVSERNAFREALNRAEAIVGELRLALDHQRAPDLAVELERLYLFVESELEEARATGEARRIADARRVLDTLYSAWRELDLRERR